METTNIYTLTDPRTNEIRYVGKANNVSQRYRAHLNRARDHQTHKRNWVNSLRKLGLKPIIDVIDIVPIEDWMFWETYWINQIKSWGFKLTNNTDGGDGCTFGNKTSFKKGDGGKKVVGYDSNGEKKYEFDVVEDASKYFNLHRSSIPACANNKSKTIKGLAWFYEEDIKNLSYTDLKIKITDRFTVVREPNSGNFTKGQKGIRSKKIILTDLITNNKIIFDSGVEAANFIGVKQPTISWCLINNKLIKKQFKIEIYDK